MPNTNDILNPVILIDGTRWDNLTDREKNIYRAARQTTRRKYQKQTTAVEVQLELLGAEIDLLAGKTLRSHNNFSVMLHRDIVEIKKNFPKIFKPEEVAE